MIIDTMHTKAQKELCIQKIADKPMELARAGNDLMMKNITVNLNITPAFLLKIYLNCIVCLLVIIISLQSHNDRCTNTFDFQWQ